MLINEALGTLNLGSETIVQQVRETLTNSITENATTPRRYSTRNLGLTTMRILGAPLLATMLTMPEINYRITSASINRTTLSAANLNVALRPHNNLIESAAYEQLSLIYSKIAGSTILQRPYLNSNYCCIHFIHAQSGLTNLKKWLAQADYHPLELDLQQYPEHKVFVYKILNTLFITSNDAENPAMLKKLVGRLPILFTESYKNLEKHPELYEFYKTSFNTNDINLQAILQLPVFKNIKQQARERRVNTFLTNIEKRRVHNVDNHINELLQHIADAEQQLRTYYTNLDTARKQKCLGTALADKELIAMCLKNNPHVENVITVRDHALITTWGPVEYDKAAMNSVLKNKSEETKWLLTNPDYVLCWESICTINLQQNDISAEQSMVSTESRLRNVHWHRYNCFGNNRIPIQKALIMQDYLSAFAQIITAAQLLNPYDVTVVSALIDTLYYDRPNCIAFMNVQTKELFSTNEMLKIYKEIQKESV